LFQSEKPIGDGPEADRSKCGNEIGVGCHGPRLNKTLHFMQCFVDFMTCSQ